MKIESISLKNFKAFKDAKMEHISHFCVLVGANGTGKTTIFSVFGFLHEAMKSNISTALIKLGGTKGFADVRSRNSDGPIKIELKFRSSQVTNESGKTPLITYTLEIAENESGKAFIQKEILQYPPRAKRAALAFS